MSVTVWTASHIDVPDRWFTLKECVESVAKLNLPHFVSLSSSIDLPDEIKSPLLTVIRHDEEKSQFGHLRFLDGTFSGSENDYILFMDDDDVLIELPKEITTRRSVQYIAHGNYINTRQCQDFMPYREGDMLSNDFSGTITTVKYFRNVPPCPANILPDIFFMVSIGNSFPDDHPYVFRRFWNPFSGYRHHWQKSLKPHSPKAINLSRYIKP